MSTQIRLAGSGGQGIILASIILAEAALLDKKFAAQSQSYGPEARGGVCKAEVVIADEEIDYPKVQKVDVLLVLTQESLTKYSKETVSDSIIVADSSLKVPTSGVKGTVISVPILQTASDVVGDIMTANVVAVGALNAIAKTVDNDALKKALFMHIPRGTEDLNNKALLEGEKLYIKT